MKYIPLPTTDQPLLEITTSLDGEFFTIVYDWNSVTDRWTMSISDSEGEILASGVTLVPNFSLLRTVSKDSRPKGVLLLVSPGDVDATIANIDNCKMLYLEDSELVSA